jgi:hypothetical protein
MRNAHATVQTGWRAITKVLYASIEYHIPHLVIEFSRGGYEVLSPASIERHHPQGKIIINKTLDLGGLFTGEEDTGGWGAGGEEDTRGNVQWEMKRLCCHSSTFAELYSRLIIRMVPTEPGG